ncbi:LysE family translocator [Pseudaestuariivita sp.]|uniref:LysE family translocator n=1 Tax=Pseudaestuariivita sp. TaxID=2211669 RepID=UPI004057DF6E
MSIETYLLYLATVAVFFATPPGTSQILIMSTALRVGARRAWITAAGDLSANTLQMLIAGLGLAALIASSATALTVIKWVGVAYLLVYGIRMFLSDAPDLSASASPVPARRLFLQGFVTSGANPEAVFFFAALFPQFIDPGAPLAPQLLILGATYLVIDGAVLAIMAVASERLLSGLRNRGKALNRIAGAMMVGAAVLLGFKDPVQRES